MEKQMTESECCDKNPLYMDMYVYIYIYIYTHTVGTESIQAPLNFSLFVILQLFAKII